jgi:hypothetical protein
MKFGVREICDVTFKALQSGYLGSMPVAVGQPVLYIDTAKTSTIEGAATTVYAQGGRGNSRLIAWEGEKTLTFTVEDALLSPIGFAILSGAGLYDVKELSEKAMVHCTAVTVLDADKKPVLEDTASTNAPMFVLEYNDGSIGKVLATTEGVVNSGKAGDSVFVDYYVEKEAVTELNIDAENFAGFYYVEASTLFRRESDGKDLPAEIVFPRVKIQSNFTFTMASSGDPSTFTFTMDAFPAYTYFDKTKKVLCAMQIINEEVEQEPVLNPVLTDKDIVKA